MCVCVTRWALWGACGPLQAAVWGAGADETLLCVNHWGPRRRPDRDTNHRERSCFHASHWNWLVCYKWASERKCELKKQEKVTGHFFKIQKTDLPTLQKKKNPFVRSHLKHLGQWRHRSQISHHINHDGTEKERDDVTGCTVLEMD